jgi:lysozyme
MKYYTPSDPDSIIYGIDLSANNGNINAQEIVDAGKQFVYLKVSEGVNYHDPRFQAYAQQLTAAGMKDLGAYHYLRVRHATQQDAKTQALQFVSLCAKANCFNLIPWLDCELNENQAATKDEWAEAIRDWVQEYIALVGKKPAIYTDLGEWNSLGGPALTEMADLPLVVAAFTNGNPPVPGPWGKDDWIIHQYAADLGVIGTCPGVADHCDLDRFRGTIEDLRSLSQ